MNKRVVIFAVLLIALLLSAVSPWPAILTVINYTGQNVYITMKYHGVQEYFLTVTKAGNTDDWNVSRFDIDRKVYDAKVSACDVTTTWGRLNLNINLRLTFTTCDQMKQWWTPKYWGEPSMEKPNFWFHDDAESVPPNGGWYGSLSWKWPFITTFYHGHSFCEAPIADATFKCTKVDGPFARSFLFLYDVTDTD